MDNRKGVETHHHRKTAAELYEVQPYYQRFNQKYNMTRQMLWDETASKLQKKRSDRLAQLAQNDRNGCYVLDRAFYLGAQTNLEGTGFSVNWPNRRGNSWESVRRLAQPGSEPLPDATSLKWQDGAAEASMLIRRLALRFGANQVGFCRLDRRWVYSHWFDEETSEDYPIKFSDEAGYEGRSQPAQLEDRTQVIPKEMQHVVVLIYEMDRDAIATAPNLPEWDEVQLAYSRISFTTASLAEFIRGLGYNAIPSSNCTALSIPLAIDAGLGQLGRNAKLINPLFGPRCRISKIITDLPLAADKPIDFGFTEFCDKCQKCARSCPAGAIPIGERSLEPVNECNHRGILTWQVDHKKCYQYWAEVGTNCGICLRTCPFNKGRGKTHDVVHWFIKNVRVADPLFIKLDDALGYGKSVSSNGFWQKTKEGV
ncbi:reductive dehalogenase [Chloroflexota bacterium]